ncbi:MAG: TIGR03067 domain-containing protein [Pirellulaceae bacterium]
MLTRIMVLLINLMAGGIHLSNTESIVGAHQQQVAKQATQQEQEANDTVKSKLSAVEMLEKMKGKWQPAEMIVAGKPMPKEQIEGLRLIIEADRYVVEMGAFTDKGTLKLAAGEEFMGIDMTGTEGPNTDKTISGLIRFEDELMVVCYDLSEQGNRPAGFESPEGSMTLLAKYKRVDADKEK